MFIVLEGLDGAGKSTQIRMLRQLLAERGVESEYVHFRVLMRRSTAN